MRRRTTVGVAVAAALFISTCFAQDPNQLSKEEQDQGFVSLFDGKDLTGWNVEEGKKEQWKVEDGILKCVGGPGKWIRTEKEYTDFELRLDFKNTPKTNSGVFLRATEKGNPAFTGMEIQICDDAANKKPGWGSTGAVYGSIAPAGIATKPPGEWNSYDITLKGMQLTVVLNGQQLCSVDLADPKLNEDMAKAEQEYKAALETAKKEGKKPSRRLEGLPFTARAKTGFIGLQNHGHEVEFRNIRIKVLQ